MVHLSFAIHLLCWTYKENRQFYPTCKGFTKRRNFSKSSILPQRRQTTLYWVTSREPLKAAIWAFLVPGHPQMCIKWHTWCGGRWTITGSRGRTSSAYVEQIIEKTATSAVTQLGREGSPSDRNTSDTTRCRMQVEIKKQSKFRAGVEPDVAQNLVGTASILACCSSLLFVLISGQGRSGSKLCHRSRQFFFPTSYNQ